MLSNITDIMKPLYHTFTTFTNTVFDTTTVPVENIDDVTGENPKLKELQNTYYEIRMAAAGQSLILDGFINRYIYGGTSEEDLAKILKIILESIALATKVYNQFQYTDDKTTYQRYKNHQHIVKNIENISMIRASVEAYNSKLVDFSEIDNTLNKYQYGAVIFDAIIDNEPIKNDTDIIMAKLTALLIKLKDGGVKWAGYILNRITMEMQPNHAAEPKADKTEEINELDQK